MRDSLKDSDRISILVADLNARQQEAIERGRSENYLFVLYFTTLGGIVAGLAAVHSIEETAPGSLGPYLPTFVLLASLATIALPIDLVHLAFGLEVRRVYVQTRLEPKLREIMGDFGELAAFTLENFDRKEHLGWPNGLIVVRVCFVWMPSTILFGYYLTLRWNNLPTSIPAWGIEIAALLGGIAAIVYSAGTSIRMKALIDQARESENSPQPGRAEDIPRVVATKRAKVSVGKLGRRAGFPHLLR